MLMLWNPLRKWTVDVSWIAKSSQWLFGYTNTFGGLTHFMVFGQPIWRLRRLQNKNHQFSHISQTIKYSPNRKYFYHPNYVLAAWEFGKNSGETFLQSIQKVIPRNLQYIQNKGFRRRSNLWFSKVHRNFDSEVLIVKRRPSEVPYSTLNISAFNIQRSEIRRDDSSFVPSHW